MKKNLMAMALLAATAAFGETWTITVPDGETKYLQTEVEALFAEKGHGFAANDVIEKEGGGRLVGTNTWASVKINLRVKEGVYEARYLGDLFGGLADVGKATEAGAPVIAVGGDEGVLGRSGRGGDERADG